MELGLVFQQLVAKARTIWIADAHADDGKRFVVQADEIMTAILELESAIGGAASLINHVVQPSDTRQSPT
jgi:hypothetical protein